MTHFTIQIVNCFREGPSAAVRIEPYRRGSNRFAHRSAIPISCTPQRSPNPDGSNSRSEINRAVPDQVVVDVGAVGICGSDLHYYEHGRIGNHVVESPLAGSFRSVDTCPTAISLLAEKRVDADGLTDFESLPSETADAMERALDPTVVKGTVRPNGSD